MKFKKPWKYEWENAILRKEYKRLDKYYYATFALSVILLFSTSVTKHELSVLLGLLFLFINIGITCYQYGIKHADKKIRTIQ